MQLKKVLVLLAVLSLTRSAFQPFSKEQLRNMEAFCIKLLDQPASNWYKYLNFNYTDDSTTHCHMRCFGITSGFYDDDAGMILDRLYQQYQSETTLSCHEYTEVKTECLRSVLADCYPEDLCLRAYLTFQCFDQERRALMQKPDC